MDVVDLKGLYEGEWVDATPTAELYGRVARAFPEAWLEDARLTDETRPVLEPHRDRLTWDFPIHSVADVDALPFPPKCLNSKPSRFGSVQRLFDFYDVCEERGIAIYGGGQFELGPGRGQIQHLASLFHADAPNDVAPSRVQRRRPAAGAAAEPAAAAVARARVPLVDARAAAAVAAPAGRSGCRRRSGRPLLLRGLLLVAARRAGASADLAMLGYLGGPRVGAACYDAVHTYVGPVVLGAAGVLSGTDVATQLALIWLTHIGVDRVVGYGLKYPSDFKDTHLQRV